MQGLSPLAVIVGGAFWRREMALPAAYGNIWPRLVSSECEQP